MNVEKAKKLKSGDEIVLKDCGMVSTIVTSGVLLDCGMMIFEVENQYDGVIDVSNNEIEFLDEYENQDKANA